MITYYTCYHMQQITNDRIILREQQLTPSTYKRSTCFHIDYFYRWYQLLTHSRGRYLFQKVSFVNAIKQTIQKPRTNFGHAPLSIQSWKSFQSVNPYYVLSWWVSPCCQIKPHIPHLVCLSVNSFKFPSCEDTTPKD